MLITAMLACLVVAPWGTPASAEVGSSAWPCPDWGMYGHDLERTFATRCETPIDPTSATTLVPKWYVDTPKTVTASPAVVDGRVYVGDWTGTMFAFDAETGDELWATPTEPAPGAPFGPIVSSAAVADIEFDGTVRRLVIFGAGPRMYALAAEDGSVVWEQYFGANVEEEQTEFESSPLVHDGVVYVGMDVHNRTLEETGGVRGGVFALDAATGETLWYFNPEWDDGRSGCSSVWASPTLDLENGHVVAASGNCPHPHTEWTPYIEAVFALDMDTGEPVWSFQPHPVNHDDFDFGATPNLFTDEDGRRILGDGNKDGSYYALDPATGEAFWSTHVQDPLKPQEDFSVGGFIGSSAIWDGDVFGGTALGSAPYYHALDGVSGEVEWQGAAGPHYAASGAAGGVVFAAALDGTFKAWDAETGRPVWSFPLSAPSSSGPAIVGDSIYIGAGTSSSDLCAKDTPVFSEVCFAVFEEGLGGTGGLHAFELAAADDAGDDDDGGGGDGSGDGSDARPDDDAGEEAGEGAGGGANPAPGEGAGGRGDLPASGGGLAILALLPLLAVAVSFPHIRGKSSRTDRRRRRRDA